MYAWLKYLLLVSLTPSDIFCPLKQLFSEEVCKSLFGNKRNGVVYFPSVNANADIKNFRHLLLDLRGSGGCWAAPAPVTEEVRPEPR